ncbi:MAG: response regulator [Gammaproteobacteria bacterium]|nr:MAG: response regulator [Gammaproteobacteria bacterium]
MANILVVDDSVTLRQMVSFVLTKAGHEVSQAESGEAALMILETFKPDLVLTDMYMPGIDGIGLAAKIRANPQLCKTPILVLSTDSSQEVKQRGRDTGVTGWVSKPFDPEKLQSLVAKVLH